MKRRLLCICILIALLALVACDRNAGAPQSGNVSEPPAAISQQPADDDSIASEGGLDGGQHSWSEDGEDQDGEHYFTVELPFVHDIYVLDTWAAPASDEPPLAVHIVRSIGSETNPLYRQYAVVVNPAKREHKIYMLTDAYVSDAYNVDSVARAYGFIDDNRLLYVSAVGDDPVTGEFTYKVAALDIRSGDVQTVIETLPNAPQDEFFVPGYMNRTGTELVLNTHQSGFLWHIDAAGQTAELSEGRYPHEWPFFLSVPSPDGDRFWYLDIDNNSHRLYTLDTTMLAEVAFPEGFEQYPPFTWSPDGQYATFAYTDNRDQQHLIAMHEVYEAATQHIHIYDRLGKLAHRVSSDSAQDEYVEPAGWLPDGEALLLRHFKLDRSYDEPRKIEFRFELLRLADGTTMPLQLLDKPDDLTNPQVAEDKRTGTLSWVDAQAGLIWHSGDKQISLLSQPNADYVRWLEHTYYDETPGYSVSVAKGYDRSTGTWSSQPLGQLVSRDPVLIGEGWITSNDLYYENVSR